MHITKITETSPRQNRQPLPPTFEAYGELQQSFDFFNGEFWGGTLPRCLITLQRGRSYYGYFCGNRFASTDGRICDEIALNPQYFATEPVLEVLGTLVHEMVHLWQHHFGRPGRGSYHNKEWAREMLRVGLHPSQTGRPGGQMTGEPMSHYILSDGAFAVAAAKLLATPLGISWFDARSRRMSGTAPISGPDESPSGKRTKFTCPVCEANAWGKASLNLLCIDCQQVMLPDGSSRSSRDQSETEPVAPRLLTEEVRP